ncbi:MAG TPA: FtsX-like permease family protein [Nocardioides sp.]|nr:FtsX-like permease family protein [Nocardioides sp.]
MKTPSTLLATVFRGLRSRALLSAGSVLLTALAIGSAVLGPIFQVAVTNSYLVTRLDEAPNQLTGLTWRFHPGGDMSGKPDVAVRGAADAAQDATSGDERLFAPAQTVLETRRLGALGGIAMLLAKDPAGGGACAHLEVAGDCPDQPGEVLLLAGDLDDTGHAVGDTIRIDGPIGEVTVVGSYRVPAAETDYWFDLQRFASTPRRTDERTGTVTPYQPAPFVTAPATFETLPPSVWTVRVDRRLDVPADLTVADIEQAQRTARAADGPAVPAAGGRLVGESLNDIASIAAEARAQQETARSSIAPAVISLVLVALALLMRLLMAAADLRLPELALASLRGLSRRQMWSLGLSEPLVLLALSVPTGAVIGLGLALGLVRWWLVPGLPLPVPWTAAAAGLTVAAAAVGVAVLAVGLVLRVSLSEQLTGVRRPRETSRTGLIVQLVLVAGAVAVLTSKLSSGTPGDPDMTDLILPVLLAVVAGVAATRLTSAAAGWWTRHRRTTRSLPGFVAARAISRRQEGTLVILPVTAAIAVCVFGAGVYGSAAQWRASVAATAAPAPVVWTSPLPMNRTVALTHEIDPDGKWLMATSRLSTLGPTFTVADVPRLGRVASWPDQWTPGVGTAEITEALTLQAAVPVVTGTEVGLTVDNDVESDSDLYMRLLLDVSGDREHYAYLGPFAPGTSTVTAATPYCRAGCELQAITIGGPAALRMQMIGDLRISDLVVDGQPVAGAVDGAGWVRSPEASAAGAIGAVETDGDELLVSLDSDGEDVIAQLSTGALPAALPVVKGVDADLTPAAGSFSATSATEFPVDPVITANSVPFLGPGGLLIDYAMLTTDRSVYEQKSTVYVLARADAPASVTEKLQDHGASVTTTFDGVRHTLDQGAYALTLRLYAVVAVLVLLMALAGLFVSTAVQLPARRRDAASLRVVGVPRRSVMSAVVREFAFVLGGTAVAGLAAGTLAQYVVLRTVTLGYVEDLSTPALIAAVDWQRLLLLASLTALLFGTVALASAGLTVRGARGSTLRENAR